MFATQIPTNSQVRLDFPKLDYADCFTYYTPKEVSIDELTTQIFSEKSFLTKSLTKFRDILVRPFGLKKDPPKNVREFYPVGSKAVLFTVISRSEDELILQEKDKHLDFRVSVFRERRGDGYDVYLTTLVHFNNRLGRIYFFFIKPFHRFIIQRIFQKLSQRIKNEAL